MEHVVLVLHYCVCITAFVLSQRCTYLAHYEQESVQVIATIIAFLSGGGTSALLMADLDEV